MDTKAGETINNMAGLLDKAKDYVVHKIADVEKPQAELSGVSVQGLNRDSATFISHVDISNPYSRGLPICEISYILKSAGRVIASGTMKDPGWINASTKTKVDVPAKVPYDILLSILKDIGRDWDIDYVLEVGLTIDLPIIGYFTIPLKSIGEMKLPTLSEMIFKK